MKSSLLALSFVLWALPVMASPPTYVSLKPQFESFLQQAKNADFETQLTLWTSEVESALPEVYLKLLSYDPAKMPEVSRREKAEKWFPFFFAHSSEILKQFDAFEKSG